MLSANHIVIPVDPAIALFWQTKFPDLSELFVGDDFYLTISPGSYRPIWGTASEVTKGYQKKFAELNCHELEGFDVSLASECNCASVYYLLKDLEKISKEVECGTFEGITIHDYLMPSLEDIKNNSEFTIRQVLMEIEQTTGSMGLGSDRSYYGTKIMFGIVEDLPVTTTTVLSP